MRVLFVNATHGWAGVKTWMLELATYLAGRGHGVHVACRRGNAMESACAARGLPCTGVEFGLDFSPRTIAGFHRLLRRQRTELVVTNVSKDLRTAGVAARLAGAAHVNRLGSDRDIKPTWRTRLLYALLVDRVIVPSAGLLEHYGRFAFLAGKLRRFPNAVVPQPWTERGGDIVRFAVIAHLSPRKQVDRVIEAFGRLLELPWELHVAGSGPELPALRRQAVALGLEGRVFFTAQEGEAAARIDTRSFLADKDVGLLYSRQEAFGWAILEYLAASCAVIAADVEGPREIVRNGVEGLLVDPDQVDALTEALRRLIVSPSTRVQLARAGHARVRREFHQDVVFPALERELAETISRHAPAARGVHSARRTD